MKNDDCNLFDRQILVVILLLFPPNVGFKTAKEKTTANVMKGLSTFPLF